MTNLKNAVRNKLIFEERSKGASDDEICEKLREKGYPTSKRTVWAVRHSPEAEVFCDELERVQLRDIALLRAYALQDTKAPDLRALSAAINARAQMLKNLMPKDRSVSVAVNVNQQSTVSLDLLAKYDALIAAEANAKASDFSRDDSQ